MKTALVVDNSELMRTVIKDLLEEQGVTTIGEASDPNEAIEKYKTLKPDLVTLDIIMPGGSGLDALRNIMSHNPSAKVLIITESGRDSVDRQVQRIGAQGLLHKPLSGKVLENALGRLRSNTPAFDSTSAKATARPKVLVVDDSMVIRSMVKEIVTECGMSVVAEAADVKPAIKAYDETLPDLVVLDLVMPNGSGIDVLQNIMARKLKTKVLIVTSIEQAKLNQELLQMGASAILHKPFTPQELKSVIRKICSFEPGEPKSIGDLTKDQVRNLEILFRSGGNACLQAMSKMTRNTWEMPEMRISAGNTEEFRAIVDRIWKMKAIPVQITVKKHILIIGLVLASRDTAQKLASAVTFNKEQPLDDELIKSVLMEWTNVLITAVLNTFANTMGRVILSSSPKVLDWPIEDIVARVPKELSDMPERLLIAHSQFHCKGLGADCETMFFLRVDYAPVLIKD